MKAYLKWYYGRQNLWDEILLFWVLQYCHQHMGITHCMIECWDHLGWIQDWIKKHQDLLPSDLSYTLVKRPRMRQQLKNMLQSACGCFPLLVLWGGEVINAIESFPHNGRNYIAQYRGNILRGKYIVLWGITLRSTNDLIASFLIKNAKALILRDGSSRQIAHTKNKKAQLYQDFAIQIIEHYKKKRSSDWKKKSYVLINMHPSKINEETIGRIQDFIQKQQVSDFWFVPCDTEHDTACYHQLKTNIPSLQYYDRTKQDIPSIMTFFSSAQAAIGARLHFLLLLKLLWVPFEALVYHDKVRKVLQLESL